MTVETLITECRRLSEVLDNHYLGDLDPVVHLTYSEAADVYKDMEKAYEFARDNPNTTLVPIQPTPGTFWVDCFGIRIFVERVEG